MGTYVLGLHPSGSQSPTSGVCISTLQSVLRMKLSLS